MQAVHKLRTEFVQKALVHVHRVSSEDATFLFHIPGDKFVQHLIELFQRDLRSSDLVGQQSGSRNLLLVVPTELPLAPVIHAVQHLIRMMHYDIRPFRHQLQMVVRDQNSHLQQGIGSRTSLCPKASHLAIHPNQSLWKACA